MHNWQEYEWGSEGDSEESSEEGEDFEKGHFRSGHWSGSLGDGESMSCKLKFKRSHRIKGRGANNSTTHFVIAGKYHPGNKTFEWAKKFDDGHVVIYHGNLNHKTLEGTLYQYSNPSESWQFNLHKGYN